MTHKSLVILCKNKFNKLAETTTVKTIYSEKQLSSQKSPSHFFCGGCLAA